MGRGLILRNILSQQNGYNKIFDDDVYIVNEVSQHPYLWNKVQISPDDKNILGDLAIVTAKVTCPPLGGYDTYGYNTFIVRNESKEYSDTIEFYCGGGNSVTAYIQSLINDCVYVNINSPSYELEIDIVHVIFFKKITGNETLLMTKYHVEDYIEEPDYLEFSIGTNDIAIIMFVYNTGMVTVDTVTLNDNGKWIADGLLEVKISGRNMTINNYDESGYYGEIEVYVISNPFIISPDSPY